MILPIKPLLYIAAPFLLFIGIVFAVQTTLGIDDLKACPDGPQAVNSECKAVDAIVAISGGDTDARTREAIELYKKGWSDTLIFSGAAEDKQGSSNAAVMRQTAIKAGVPESAIQIEEYGADTAGNASGVAQIVDRQEYIRMILVTSPYHQRRAYMEFAQAMGPSIKIINHPTAYDKYWLPEVWWLNPYSWYLAITELVKMMYVKVA